MNGNTKDVYYVKPRIANFYVLGYNDYTLTLPFPTVYDTWNLTRALGRAIT